MSSTFDNHCGQCGFFLPPGSTSCPRCGAPVMASQPGATTPPPNQPSEYFPGFVEQIDSAETMVRLRPDGGWDSQPSGVVSPFSPPPGSGTLPTPPVQTGPTGPQSVPFSGLMPGAPSAAPWPTPQSSGDPKAQPPFGPPSGGLGWQGTPPPSTAPLTGSAPYQGQSFPGAPTGWPSGEAFGPATQAPYGAPPGAYAPGGPGFIAPPPKAPLPRWFTIGAAVLVALGLFLVWLTGSDWANGGVRAGIAALVVGGIVLIAFLVRLNQGYRGTRTVRLAVASVLVLIIVGVAGIALQNPIHSAQASSLDGQQQFQAAINEYKLANNTEGIARTYNDWGEYLLSQHHYQVPSDPTQDAADGTQLNTNGALNKFAVVLNHYQSVSDQVSRAVEGEVNAYLAWGTQYLNQSDYQNAVSAFQKAIAAKDVLGSASNYSQIHQDAAKAYLGLGQQQLTNGDCTDAVTDYQTLSQDYSDTSQGQQAATDLKKPQSVTGQLIDAQKDLPAANVRLFMSSNYEEALKGSVPPSHDFTALSDSTGKFTFANVPPGSAKYLISYVQAGQGEVYIVSRATGQPDPKYIVQATPLCSTDVGTMPYNLGA